MSNIFALVSYACGGKTSLLPVIKWNLKLKYPDKHIVVLNESVSYGFVANDIIQTMANDIEVLDLLYEDSYELTLNNIKSKLKAESIELDTFEAKIRRQLMFLSTSLSQIDLLSNFIDNKDFVIVMDRSFIDVFIFTYMAINDFANVYKENDKVNVSVTGLELIFKKFVDLIKDKYKIDLIKDINYIFLKPPKNKEIVKRCMERKERKATIKYDDFYKKCDEFELLITKYLLKDATLKKFTHPSDNTYVAYKILEFVENLID